MDAGIHPGIIYMLIMVRVRILMMAAEVEYNSFFPLNRPRVQRSRRAPEETMRKGFVNLSTNMYLVHLRGDLDCFGISREGD